MRIKYKKMGTFFLLILSMLTTTSCTGTRASTPADLKREIGDYLVDIHFNGSVLIAKQGEIILEQGYGKSNYEENTDNTPETKFFLCSVAKQFTAAAILQLQDQGLLNVNDKVSKYINSYVYFDQITLHNLLSHTSGIKDNANTVDTLPVERLSPDMTDEELISFYMENQPLKGPGEFEYSNPNYFILKEIVEVVSGMPFESYLQENLFDKIGMKNSGVDTGMLEDPDYAIGYTSLKYDRADEIIDSKWKGTSLGAGGLYSTVEDLYLWDQALYTEDILSAESLKLMMTPYENNFGYGWVINKSIQYHNGNFPGYTTRILRKPDEQVILILLSNTSDYSQDINAISNTIMLLLNNAK